MKTPAYSLWDTLPDLRHSHRWIFGLTPAAIRAGRCERRTRRYRLAADMIEDPGLERDLLDRHSRWESHMNAPPLAEKPESAWQRDDWFWLGGFEILATLGALAIAIEFTLALIALAGVGILHIFKSRHRRRCRLALLHRRCPNCSYDLTGVPDAIDRSRTGGIGTGPPNCTECGVPWPLLPPPARREEWLDIADPA